MPDREGADRRRYRYAMVSSEVRSDLQRPLAFFDRLEVHHFYRTAPWNDMKAAEFNERTIRYRWPWQLFAGLWRVKPEIVQGPEPFSLLMFPFLTTTLLYLWLRPRTRLVSLSLEPIPLGEKYHPLVVPLFRLVLRFWFRRARVVFWLDRRSRDNLLANGADPGTLVHLLYASGIDPTEFSPEGEKAPLGAAGPNVMYVGRLSPVKGVTYLLDAFKLLVVRGSDAHLTIVGDGPERANLEAQATSLGLTERITWTGTVKHTDLPPYLRAATVLVLPSITSKLWVQQLSQTAWQAMGCGVPVISTQTGCMDEFTPPATGILVPERDAPALAAAIASLLDDPVRRKRMALAARAYAVERFDMRRNIELAEKIILKRCG